MQFADMKSNDTERCEMMREDINDTFDTSETFDSLDTADTVDAEDIDDADNVDDARRCQGYL
jgi:hypothetical protein